MTDVFREVRERVSAQEAARFYGLTFDRRGWALCPFHRDRHPSMSFKNGRFRCWSCNASGDAIDFTARLLGLDPLGAVRRLNADFRLGLPIDREPTEQDRQEARRHRELVELHRAFEHWRESAIRQLNDAFREAHMILRDCTDLDRLTEREAYTVRVQAQVEHWADTLAGGSAEEQFELFRDRKEVGACCNRILSDSRTNSRTA